MGLRGRMVPLRGAEQPWPERALLVAILLQAIRDAHGGDAEAAAWLAVDGASWADVFLDVSPAAFAQWAGWQERDGRRAGAAKLTGTARCAGSKAQAT